jgi:ABC-type transport system involved in cytochrome bd biosynthesis fused ATPase/permease subunit
VRPRLAEGGRALLVTRLLAAGLGQAALGVLGVWLLLRVVDGLQPGVVLGLVGVVLAAGGLRAAERALGERLSAEYVHALRGSMVDCLLERPAPRDRSLGAVAVRTTGELGAVRTWVARGLAPTVSAVPMVIGTLAAIAWLVPVSAAASGLVVAVAAALAVLLSTNVRAADLAARRARGRFANGLLDRLGALPGIHAIGDPDSERRWLARRSAAVRDAMTRRGRALGSVAGVGEAAAVAAPAAALVALTATGAPAGEALPVLVLAGLLGGPLRDLARAAELRAPAEVAMTRVDAWTRRSMRPLPPVPADAAPHDPTDVVVAAGTEPSRRRLVVPEGRQRRMSGTPDEHDDVVAAVVAALAGEEGRVWVGGFDVGTLNAQARRDMVAVVSADSWWPDQTVSRALRARSGVRDEAAQMRVVEAVGLVDRLGDDPLRARCRRLGPTERLLLGLAAAALVRPPLLVVAAHANDRETRLAAEQVLATWQGTVLVLEPTGPPALAAAG